MIKKITRAGAWIKLGLQEKLYLCNLEAVRDRGYTGEYVEAMRQLPFETEIIERCKRWESTGEVGQ